MQALLQERWNTVLESLHSELGPAVYDAWIGDLVPLRLERGICHLEAPTRMAAERVQQLFAGSIADRLSEAFGTRIDVSVRAAQGATPPDELEVTPTRPLVDGSNRTAWLALHATLEGREMPSRLFLFHGPAGCGKTFLLDWWRRAWPHRPKPMVFDGDGLLRAFQASLRDGRLGAFVDELSDPDRPLVLDEVHRLSGRVRLQETVLRVLETRERDGNQPTVLASRWHPHDIRDLDPSLATWMLRGFVQSIEPPGPVARLGYLRALEGAASRNGRAAEIERLAREVRGSYPELREAWRHHRGAADEPRRRGKFQLIEPRAAFERICKVVCEAMDVEREDLTGSGQKRRVSMARKVLAYLCVQEGLSRAEVGRFLSRTRAAISYAVQSLEETMRTDAELRAFVESLA